jgi:DNA-binding MarR family transcriptional regulator
MLNPHASYRDVTYSPCDVTMFGSKSRKTDQKSSEFSVDVAKLFFDRFSSRVALVEQGLRTLGTELEKIKLASERSQVSDLVLLDRVQRSEGLLEESLNWIKRVAELMPKGTVGRQSAIASVSQEAIVYEIAKPQGLLRQIVSPSGEAGSLSSITTPTEMQVLSLLSEKGALAAPEIGRLVGRSREHTARLMKRLFEEGYVRRDQNRIPFRYSLVERVKQSFSKASNTIPLEKEGSTVEKEEKGVVAQPPPA